MAHVIRSRRLVTVEDPTRPGVEEDWEVEEEHVVHDYNDVVADMEQEYTEMRDPQEALFASNAYSDPWGGGQTYLDEKEDDLVFEQTRFSPESPGKRQRPETPDVPPEAPFKGASGEPNVTSSPRSPERGEDIGENGTKKAKQNNDNNDEVEIVQPPNKSDDPFVSLPGIKPAFLQASGQGHMVALQRYINRRALETAAPLREFISALVAKMGLSDARVFYKDGKAWEQLWLIRNYKDNRDEFAVIRHNAGHLSKELLLQWMREWWQDNERLTGELPGRGPRAFTPVTPSAPPLIPAPEGRASEDKKPTSGTENVDELLQNLRAELIGNNDNNGLGVFARVRAMEARLGPQVIPRSDQIIETHAWQFNLMNYDVVQRMILSEVGMGTLRVALEALQYHIPMAKYWNVPMILASPVARIYFAWWAQVLLTAENANAYPGRVYLGSNSGSATSTPMGNMAFNISSGIKYQRLRSKIIRGFQKLFAPAYTAPHQRVVQQEHHVARLEWQMSQSTDVAERQRLANQLVDARDQLEELRVRLPMQLILPSAE